MALSVKIYAIPDMSVHVIAPPSVRVIIVGSKLVKYDQLASVEEDLPRTGAHLATLKVGGIV